MTLLEKINADMISAMKSKEKDKLEALRAVKTALSLLRTQENATEITEEMEIKLLQKLVKQRRDAAFIYNAQGRGDLEFTENQQIMFIEQYLPHQMDYENIESHIGRMIWEMEKTPTIKDMGTVIKQANKELSGRAESKVIAEIVKNKINELNK